MKQYVVELRGLSFATTGESWLGRPMPLVEEEDTAVDAEPLVFSVYSSDAKAARERVRDALLGLLDAEVNGDGLARREPPGSW